MRAATDMPGFRRTPGKGRVTLIFVGVVLFLIVTSLRQVAEFWTDYLWFNSVELSQVWSRTLGAKVGLALFFTLLFFGVLLLNLVIADRLAPRFRPLGPDDELLTRYRQLVDRRAGVLRLGIAALFALLTGVGMSSQWNEWLLFNNGGSFGKVDPEFGLDIGFYVFKLPFVTAVVDWAFASLFIILLVTVAAHYLNGGIRMQAPMDRVGAAVKAHLSTLLAVLALIKAVDYYLQRYAILFSSRGTVDGATYTEVNAQRPAMTLLGLIALAAFGLFIVNIRRRGWVLPVVAVGLWAFVHVVVGEAYPAVFQQFLVTPQESEKELSAIQHNIEATRSAYGLDRIEQKTFEYDASPEAATKAINDNPAITRNVQLLDPKRVLETFRKKQSQLSPLQFNRVATDRYPMTIDGKLEKTQVVLSNREMDAAAIPNRSWESEKLIYTHGYGFALAAGNAVDSDGAPAFAVRDIPIVSSINLTDSQPDNYYFGPPSNTQSAQTLPDYSVVNTGSAEWDPVRRASAPDKTYTGKGGVPLDSFLSRAAFYLRFGNINLLISGYIKPESKILYNRDIRQRALAVAPFLAFDGNPYPAVVDRKTVYILDAYTTTDRYPNAEHYPNEDRLVDSPNLRTRAFNYVRNSVKVVVDSYDGSMSLYIQDKNDPIVMAYDAAFPGLFKDKSLMSQDLRDHLRYPEDIFGVQTDMWGRYHIDDARQFYKREDAWEPPVQPLDRPPPASAAQSPAQLQALNAANLAAAERFDSRSKIKIKGRMAPYYVLNKLQGDTDPNFMLMRSYQPFSEDDNKNQLTSFIVARSDGDDFGKLDLYRMPAGENIDGPTLAGDQILTDTEVSKAVSLLNTQGSAVWLSDLMLVPIDKSIMYVRSMYVEANDTQLVRYVILYAGEKVYAEPTLRAALRRAFPGSDPKTLEAERTVALPGAPPTPATPPGSTPGGTTPGSTVPGGPVAPPTSAPGGDVAGLVAQARKAFDDADTALRAGDLPGYAAKVKEAQDRIREAERLSGTTPLTTPPTTLAPAPTNPVAIAAPRSP